MTLYSLSGMREERVRVGEEEEGRQQIYLDI